MQEFLVQVSGVSKAHTEHKDFILTREAWHAQQTRQWRHRRVGQTLSFAVGAKLVRIPQSHTRQVHEICH